MGGAVLDDGPPGVKAPDGGWGWAVLTGCFVVTGFSYAFPKAVSVFFKELIREFDVGYSDTAWISSILLAMLYGTGPLCSILVNKFGCRPVMMVGGLFASLGMILSSFATSIMYIYFCTGVITGRLLDATHQYMYVFLLAGCEVTLSAFVISLGNFLCISKKQEDSEAKMEMAVVASEKERLNCEVEDEEDDKGKEEPKKKENGGAGAVKAEDMMMAKEMEE